jgi:hypothetical protein
MSVDTTIARIAEIQTMLAPRQPATAAQAGATQFNAALASATSPGPIASAASVSTPTGVIGGTAGQRALAAAQAEVGVAEQPPGSNDSPRIAEYRQATSGSGVGPWCSYFVSWAANQAGAPLGEQGQGLGATIAVEDWGKRTGRALPAGSTPQPGDLIVWGSRHIGIVESVDAQGNISTIEGNSSDKVSRRTYGPDGGGATSYVRLG